MQATEAPLGLRERKKIKTRQAIRREAFRLFDANGYAATTVEQIADAAEVSPSTFFRYFPSKESLLLADDLDPLILAAFKAQPPELSPEPGDPPRVRGHDGAPVRRSSWSSRTPGSG